MVSGGFGRKLDASQVSLYKVDWNQIVAGDRTARHARSAEEAAAEELKVEELIDELKKPKGEDVLGRVISMLDDLGKTELRDEYIEQFIQSNPADKEAELFYRQMQGRPDLITTQSFTFSVPILQGPQYQPSRTPVEVDITWPGSVAGPGGIRVYSSVDQAAQVLSVFKTFLPSLTPAQLQQIEAVCGVVPPANAIDNAVSYLGYLKTREQTTSSLLSLLVTLTHGPV
jgi:hypothetical protein